MTPANFDTISSPTRTVSSIMVVCPSIAGGNYRQDAQEIGHNPSPKAGGTSFRQSPRARSRSPPRSRSILISTTPECRGELRGDTIDSDTSCKSTKKRQQYQTRQRLKVQRRVFRCRIQYSHQSTDRQSRHHQCLPNFPKRTEAEKIDSRHGRNPSKFQILENKLEK